VSDDFKTPHFGNRKRQKVGIDVCTLPVDQDLIVKAKIELLQF
jgi:hypothetical protein